LIRSTEFATEHKALRLLTEFENEIGYLQVHRIISLALDFLAQRLDISRVSVALLEGERTGFRILEVRHQSNTLQAGIFIPYANTVLSEVVESRKHNYRPDISRSHARFTADERFVALGLKSEFLVPLIVEDECIGTLNAASIQTDGIREEDRKLLTLLAPRLAQALKNAQLFEALQNAHGRLEQLVAERTSDLRREIEVRKKTEADLQRAHDELEQRVAERTAEIVRLKNRLQAENIFLREELEGIHGYGDIIGESQPLKMVIKQIELAAPTDVSVLILGESGTGKELIAREIHRHSLLRDRPMIKVNCATIPRELYESEFFGHVRGAFTGATRDRQGRFEAADGGTLFLDEVGEIPLQLQSKLLRVLQEGEYERVGDTKTRKVTVRIIAATNLDLKRGVEERRFREDLFYRLNVFPIEIAPLRKRKEDIPLLANHFLDHLAKRLNRPRLRLTQANLLDLQNYDWPGNVRELQNVIERAVILSRSGSLHFEFPRSADPVQSPRDNRDRTEAGFEEKILTEREMRERSRENILAVLRTCNWKVYGPGGAAELLGIKPTTLVSRIRKLGIRKPL
jgi:transcriptional regulator with GAF, ATPase, and Fis domain